MRGLGHRLHAAGHDDVGLASLDHEIGKVNRVEARQAHLVDGGRGNVHADAALDRRLTGRDLALPGEQYLSHEDVLDAVGRDTRTLERRLDSDATKVHCGERCESPRELANRGTSTSDDHGPGHGDLQKRTL